MPLLHKESIGAAGLWGIWEITESAEALGAVLVPNQPDGAYFNSIHHPGRFLQTLASRVLAQLLLNEWEVSYAGIDKDGLGKPFLIDCPYYISLSHTEGYAAVILHRHRPVGIDIETIKEKLARVAPRVFTEAEQQTAHNNLLKTAVYWCAKEAVYKMSTDNTLLLREVLLKDFRMNEKGTLFGHIEKGNLSVELQISYRRMITFIVAYCIDTGKQPSVNKGFL